MIRPPQAAKHARGNLERKSKSEIVKLKCIQISCNMLLLILPFPDKKTKKMFLQIAVEKMERRLRPLQFSQCTALAAEIAHLEMP